MIKQPDGSFAGIIPDFLNYLGDMIGQKLYLSTETDLKQTYQRVSDSDQFGIAVTLDSPDQRQAFLFTDAYYQAPLIVFTHKNKVDKIAELADLKGKTVAIVQGHASTEHYLQQVKGVSIVYTSTPEEQLQQLQYGEVDAIVGYTNYHYLIEKHLYTNLIPAFSTEEQFPIYMGVKPQYAPLVGILNKAIATIGDQQRSQIISHWLNQHMPVQQDKKNLSLSDEEKLYLSRLRSIRVCGQVNSMPYEQIDDEGNYYGIVADYMNLFSAQLQVPIEVVATENDLDSLSALSQNRCDVVAAHALEDNEPPHYLATQPYLDSPQVFAVPSASPPVSDFNALTSGRIGVVIHSAEASFLSETYPHINLITVASIRQGLQMVANHELDAFVGVLGSISYSIQKLALSSVKIGGAIPRSESLAVLVSQDQAPLLSIFNKAIRHLSPQDRKQIISRWISVTYDNGLNYRTLAKFGGAVLMIVGFLLYRQDLIRRSNLALMAAHQELEEKNRELNRLSMTDKLTGLLNRHAIEPIIDHEVGRHKRSNHPVSLLIVDLDHFKQINDTYGHAAGDSVLKAVATALAAVTRSSDSLARWGGEEFLMVAGDTRILKATAMAEKIRQTIAGLDIDDIPITASIGVAEFNTEETFHQWYERCDKALYQAKSSGRNCVKVAQLARSEVSAPMSISNVLQLSWNHKFCCGYDAIDEQHMGLFTLGNELIEAFLMCQEKNRVHAKLEELYQKNCEHFRFEEQLLEEVHYPNRTEHRHEHRLMEEKLLQLLEDYRENPADYSDLLHYISIDLISGHLLCTDSDYFPYLLNHTPHPLRIPRS